MSKFFKLVGMEWAGLVLRTAFQAGLVIVVAAGTNFVDGQLWRSAALAAGAAALAKLQSLSRDA